MKFLPISSCQVCPRFTPDPASGGVCTLFDPDSFWPVRHRIGPSPPFPAGCPFPDLPEGVPV